MSDNKFSNPISIRVVLIAVFALAFFYSISQMSHRPTSHEDHGIDAHGGPQDAGHGAEHGEEHGH